MYFQVYFKSEEIILIASLSSLILTLWIVVTKKVSDLFSHLQSNEGTNLTNEPF